jgi:lipopolysaccharide/colanic/teichoic acid biosynthesis glycosyltransferase
MLKRLFDITLSLSGIILSSPLWLLIAILIYMEDHGKIFFTQNRVGFNGTLFKAYKFRSMKSNETQDASKELQASENDPRVTRVGKILRATAMDELPQLINILKGDMSFVGPRALLPNEVEIHQNENDEKSLQELFAKRCTVTPGLTGVAQIFLPRDVPREKKFEYDLLYIQRRSFLFDLKLIFLSFWITLRGKWESRENKLGHADRTFNV